MQYWFERFKELRVKKKMSQGKMARVLGIDSSSVSRYERSKELGKEDVDLTENFLMRLGKFFTEEEIEYIENGKPTQGNDIVSDAGTLYTQADQVSIPYHKEVYASAGGGSGNHSMAETSPITFSKHFLNTFLGIYNLKGLSIINAAGDSMDPTIKSGELMFVYPMENEDFKDGGVYVLMCSDVLLVKRVTFNPLTKEYTLLSDNGKVDPVELTIDEASDCRFIGRVVGHLDRV